MNLPSAAAHKEWVGFFAGASHYSMIARVSLSKLVTWNLFPACCVENFWVSKNLGVFLCPACATTHRSLKDHMSQCSSLKVETASWELDTIQVLKNSWTRQLELSSQLLTAKGGGGMADLFPTTHWVLVALSSKNTSSMTRILLRQIIARMLKFSAEKEIFPSPEKQ